MVVRPVVNLYQAVQFLDWNGSAFSCKSGSGADKQIRQILQEKTMSVYMIADIKVTDNKWVPAYAASVHELVHKHGGKYLSRSGNVETLEGSPLDTNLIALIQFPSPQAVKGFLADPEYAPFAAARKSGSESRFQLIDDTDLAGTIPYLSKGK
jgi:uncharacterized protein (DUF1330 family)